MTQAERESYLDLLDFLQSNLEEQITNYSIESTEDLFDEDYDCCSRVVRFSRGEKEFYVVITPFGEIRAIHKRIPRDLLVQVTNSINSFIYDSLLDDS
jgi:hypothetical protein